MEQPLWLGEAWRELGQIERKGNMHNPRIVALYRDAGHPEISADEVAWCAAFVGACLARAKVPSTGSLMARSYLKWGAALDATRFGAIAVFSRGSNADEGHVAFCIGETDDALLLLGGNQSDSVSVMAMPKAKLLGLRWPLPISNTAEQPAPADAAENAGFDAALGHVLEMEGGFTEDVDDPGGPTNFGIILSEYAAWMGETLDQTSTARLKQALRDIKPETVRAIYLANYWKPAGCESLPPALAFLHFDAAVNQGVGTAIRFLQLAVGAEADGEIGPVTRAAIAHTPVAAALTTYADLRRQRYRSLAQFSRFGRGWLKRVDITLARAQSLEAGDVSSTSQQQGAETMTDTSPQADTTAASKWWGHSMTIWGTIITGLAGIVPVLGPAIGIDISGDLVQTAGDQVAGTVQAITALAGTLLSIYGRVRATQPLVRRAISLKL